MENIIKTSKILILCICVGMLVIGCSDVNSSRYLHLVKADGEFHEFEGHDWVTKSREHSFGKYRPPLYKFDLEGKRTLVVYPVLTSRRSFTGPPLLPIFPAPESLCVPVEYNILQFVYYGDPEEIRIEMIDDWAVDLQVVKQTKVFGGTMFSLGLTETLVADEKLVVKLLCKGEHMTLEFQSDRFTHFIPCAIPL